jgi:hypothetical protein
MKYKKNSAKNKLAFFLKTNVMIACWHRKAVFTFYIKKFFHHFSGVNILLNFNIEP